MWRTSWPAAPAASADTSPFATGAATNTSPTTPVVTNTAHVAAVSTELCGPKPSFKTCCRSATFHLVLTVPASLRPFFSGKGRGAALDALFAAVSEIILEAAARRGLRPGVLAVLHTWTQRFDPPAVHHLSVPRGKLQVSSSVVVTALRRSAARTSPSQILERVGTRQS